MAAVLMASGATGKRFSLPNSRFLIHQPLAYGMQGQATDIEIHARDLLKMRERINQILAQHTGQSIEKVSKDTDRDYILEAEDAKKYGLVDAIYHRRDDLALKAAGEPALLNPASWPTRTPSRMRRRYFGSRRGVSRGNRGRSLAPRERSRSRGIRLAVEPAAGRAASRCAGGADPEQASATGRGI